ncbi:MAG: hypothetical protein ACYC1C_13555 [Chloroflexota bacterium]
MAAIIWAGTLLLAIGAFLPNLIAWLSRGLGAARNIERYTVEILESANGIAANTAGEGAIKDTIAAASPLIDRLASLERHASAIAEAMAARGPTGTGGSSPQEGEG